MFFIKKIFNKLFFLLLIKKNLKLIIYHLVIMFCFLDKKRKIKKKFKKLDLKVLLYIIFKFYFK